MVLDMEAYASRWEYRVYKKIIEHFDSRPGEAFWQMVDQSKLAEFGSELAQAESLLKETQPGQLQMLESRYQTDPTQYFSEIERLTLRALWAQKIDLEFFGQLRFAHRVSETDYVYERLRSPRYQQSMYWNMQSAIANRSVLRARLYAAGGAAILLGGTGYLIFW